MKELIFRFAYVSCSNVVNGSFRNWMALHLPIDDAMDRSMGCFPNGDMHAIYPSGLRNRWCIKNSGVKVNEDQYQRAYARLRNGQK